MKKIIHQDVFGKIVEYRRYRGKHGQFVSDAYGKRWLKKRKITESVEQWRFVGKRRTERIMYSYSPKVLMKKTYPGSLEDHEGDIYSAIEDTNVFTQISQSAMVLYNVSGYDSRRQYHRFQGFIKTGQHHQDQQLSVAVAQKLADEGFFVWNPDDKPYYELQVVQSNRSNSAFNRLKPLHDTQIAITLLNEWDEETAYEYEQNPKKRRPARMFT